MSQSITAAFDTFEFVEQLKNAGVPESQAKAHSKTINKVLSDFENKRLSEIATKSDLISAKNELSKEIADTKAEILKWMIGMLFAQGAFIASIIKFF